MAKRVVAAAVVLVLLVAALPPVLGIVYERSLRERLSQPPANPYFSVELSDYRRGLYASRATFRFGYADEYLERLRRNMAAGSAGQDDREAGLAELVELMGRKLEVNTRVEHGPVTFGDGLRFELAHLRALGAVVAGKQREVPLQAHIHVGFGDLSRFHAAIPPLNSQQHELRINFSGLETEGSYDHGQRTLLFTGRMEGLHLEHPDGHMSVRGLSAEFDLDRIDDLLWMGGGRVDVRELRSRDGGDSVWFNLLGADFRSTLNEAGDRISFDLRYRAGSLSGLTREPLSDLELVMSLSELDREATGDYIRLGQELALATPQAAEQRLPELREILFRMLQGSPSFALSPLAFSLNDERFMARLTLDFDATVLPAHGDGELLVSSPALVMAGVSAEGGIEAPELMVQTITSRVIRGQMVANLPEGADPGDAALDEAAERQSAALLGGLIERQWIRRQDNAMSSSFSYANGELTVNGIQVPLGN